MKGSEKQAHLSLMTDILEQRADIFLLRLLPQQMILNPAHRTILAIVDKVVPRACITIQHSLRFDELSTILATLALESVVRVAAGL
jgi:hypothetical protein